MTSASAGVPYAVTVTCIPGFTALPDGVALELKHLVLGPIFPGSGKTIIGVSSGTTSVGGIPLYIYSETGTLDPLPAPTVNGIPVYLGARGTFTINGNP